MKIIMYRSPMTASGASSFPRSQAANQVLQTLQNWQNNHSPKIGHQDALAYGNNWQYENGYINEQQPNGNFGNDGTQYSSGKSDIVDLTGKQPTVFGWDIGNFYSSRNYLINGVLKEDLIRHMQYVHSIGGINTISWHCPNPTKAEGYGEFSRWNDPNYYGGNAISNINVAGSTNQRFNNWLVNVINFFGDSRLQGMPIIFRPWHEGNCNKTFWWDKTGCSNTAQFIGFWRLIFDIFCSRFNNLLFAYSINDVWMGNTAITNNFVNTFTAEFNSRFPGNDYAHIIGLDIYQKTNADLPMESNQNFISRFRYSCQALQQLSNGKPCVIAETGHNAISNALNSNWWHTIFQNAIQQTPVAYAMLWRNPFRRKDPNSLRFAAYPGSNDANSFVQFFNNNQGMFINP